MKVIFNGNGYDVEQQNNLIKLGLCNIDSTVDAIQTYTSNKNVALFEELNILTKKECEARQSALLDNYVKTVEMEANCMADMIRQQIIPALHRSLGDRSGKLLTSMSVRVIFVA